jgi:xylulokinase
VSVVIGIDVGTQSLKAVVCDDGMRVLGDGGVAYGTDHPRAGWAEQDPAAWERALAPAIAQALRAAGVAADDVTGLAIAGQLDGCVAVDAAGRALAPCLIWQDRRGELPAIDRAAVLARTGQVLAASHMAAKIRWLAARVPAARFHQPVSYLVERVTGAAVIDPAQASTTLLYELAAGGWSPAQLAAFAIDPATLPRISPAHAVAGALHAAGAALTGLRAGIPVAVGTGDDFATPLGAGIVAPGTVACVIGTAEVVGALHPTPVIDRDALVDTTGGVAPRPAGAAGRVPTPHRHATLVETHVYPAGGYFIENPGWMSGGAITWLGALLGEPDPAALDALAEPIAPGAEGLTFLPALTGAMTPVWDAGARGAFYGLTPAHGRGHLVRAVLEAMAQAERDVIDRLAALGIATSTVVVLGGGRGSAVWSRIRADATGRPHAPAARDDTCAIAAAMLAAVATGMIADVGAAAALAPPPGPAIDPDPATRAIYDEAHARGHRLFAALRPLFGSDR